VTTQTATRAAAIYTVRRASLPATHTVLIADVARRALMSLYTQATGRPATYLAGRATTDHAHPYYLPVDDDGDGTIDRLIVFFPPGVQDDVAPILPSLSRLTLPWGTAELDCQGIETSPRCPFTAPSDRWISATPFVRSRHLNRHQTLEDLVLRELAWHGHPAPMRITKLQAPAGWARFTVTRPSQPPQSAPISPRPFRIALAFPRPVPGPIAIGYGAHFGLGLMRAA
jgi:CRISPR-associated protein Csb2